MKVFFSSTLKEAEAFEAKCLAQARAAGQVCERWAEIIVSKEGYGVPVKDRLNVPEKSRAIDWTPEAKDVPAVR